MDSKLYVTDDLVQKLDLGQDSTLYVYGKHEESSIVKTTLLRLDELKIVGELLSFTSGQYTSLTMCVSSKDALSIAYSNAKKQFSKIELEISPSETLTKEGAVETSVSFNGLTATLNVVIS